MLPALSTDYRIDMPAANTKTFSNFISWQRTIERPDGADIISRDLSHTMALAFVMCAVFDFIGSIPNWCLPRKMPWIDATKATIPAGMRSLMLWCWRRAVNLFTSNARDNFLAAIEMEPAITIGASRKRPNQALTAYMRKHYLAVKLQCRTAPGPDPSWVTAMFPSRPMISTKAISTFGRLVTIGNRTYPPIAWYVDALWVSVLSPSLIVGVAPAARQRRLAAVLNRAYGFRSHLAPRTCWLG